LRLPPVGKLVSALVFAGSVLPAIASTHLVRMVNFAFQPNVLTVNVGDTVLWTNTVATFHNAVSSNSAWVASATFPSPGTFAVTFTNAGTYGYFCTPHRFSGMTGIITVQAPNQPPAVALTNPPGGITLAAPATVILRASASDPDGNVANVQFFSGTTLLGNAMSSPYALAVSNLVAGPYSFTARAVDNLGLSRTSTAVTVSVVTPGTIRFNTNFALVNGQLPLRVTVTPGLRYAIDHTAAFVSWLVFTNFVATNSVMEFAVPTADGGRRFLRARLLPNP